MKKVLSAVLLLCVALLTVGCSVEDAIQNIVTDGLLEGKVNGVSADETFEIEAYHLTLKTDDKWVKTDAENFDVQISDGNSRLSVMAYRDIDLAEGQTPAGLYTWHTEDLLSRRENVETVEGTKTQKRAGKTMQYSLHSAERNGNKNYYLSCLVTFDDQDEVFVWVLYNGTPSYVLEHREEALAILDTLSYGQ